MQNSFFDTSLLKQMMPKQGLSATPVFDLAQIVETQRKNLQAATEALQLGMSSLQQVATRQAELMGKMVQDNSSYASTIMTEGTPEQKVQRQADLVRKSYEATVAGARELGDIISKSGEEAADIINRRVTASLSEFKAAFDSKGSAAPSWSKQETPSSKPTSGKAKKRKAA